ncbi:hypothetical protein DSECCO2_571320 [anaerobic digester metagenome]
MAGSPSSSLPEEGMRARPAASVRTVPRTWLRLLTRRTSTPSRGRRSSMDAAQTRNPAASCLATRPMSVRRTQRVAPR